MSPPRRLVCLASLLLLAALPVAAQPTALVGGTVHPISGPEIDDGVVLLRNYGIALGVISIVFSRTATREDIDERNQTALNIAFKLGIANTIIAFGMMVVQLLML